MQELTDDELLLADTFLSQQFPGRSFSMYSTFPNVLAEFRNDTDTDRYQRLSKLVHETQVWRQIRNFLSEEEYIIETNRLVPEDKLTDKGKKARDLGGHKAYLAWEETERKKKNIEDFPKKKWYIYEPAKAI